MKILMVCARYLPFAGGIEAHVREVAIRIVAAGHDVTILTTDPGGTLARAEQHDGVKITRVKAWPRRRDYYFAPKIAGLIADGDWDIVHIQGYHTAVAPLAMWAVIQRQLPFVLTFHSGGHSSQLRNAMRGLQHRLLTPLVRRAAQLIAVSEFEASRFSQSMAIALERFSVVPNGAQLSTAPTAALAGKQGPLIVSIGRLEKYKGHQRAVEAFAHVCAELPDARLRILGEGPYKQQLVALVSRLGLADRVEIQGIPIDRRAEMTEVLAQASLVVLLSDYEAHPVAIMEALSLQRPVLVADSAGLGEIASKGLAAAVPLNAPPLAVAKAMVEQIAKPLPAVNIALPDWDHCTQRLLDIYRDVIINPAGYGSGQGVGAQVIEIDTQRILRSAKPAEPVAKPGRAMR